MAYSELYMGDELPKLQDGLEVLEKVVSFDAISDLSFWLYGIVKDPYILDIAKEAIAEDENSSLTEGDIDINES